MPELPEVETIRQQLAENISEKRVEKIEVFWPKILRESTPEDFNQQLKNAKVTLIKRRAKILIIEFDNNLSLLIHLKLSGRLIYDTENKPVEKHTHLIFHFKDKTTLRFWDLRRFGYMKIVPTEEVAICPEIKELGPEPLANEFTFSTFKSLFQQKRGGKVKPVLMDQTFITGIGNIYADEICFAARIHPTRNIKTLLEKELKNLHQQIRKVLIAAIKEKGSSLDEYRDLFGQPGRYHFKLQVYGREGEKCFSCSKKIERIKLGGRSSYFCPGCQK
jgi:formamidopyrimidine-DNA glycosylase